MATQWDLIHDIIPDDQAIQVDADYYIRQVGSALRGGSVVVDLGCGIGASRRTFQRHHRDLRWIGVDIPSSPEVGQRGTREGAFVTFDGIRLPFSDSSIDCVFSDQVLEHVRHPEALLGEVTRVLQTGGVFIGTTSNLEPYHSFSYWSFTLFGFRTIVEAAGMQVREVRPGIDGPTLIRRQILNRPAEMSRYFSETSPFNAEIIEWGRATKRRPARINNRMLQFCGHFGFHAVKPIPS